MHRPGLILRSSALAVLTMLLLIAPAAAGDFRSGDTVTVAGGETIDEDLYVGGGVVAIDGAVNGDATIGAGTVTINGAVTGSLNVGGGTVDLIGDVGGAVRVAGGTVRIAGTVGRDLVVAGGTVTIESGAEVAGDVAGGAGTLTVAGTVGGDLLSGTGTIEIRGTVEGDVDVSVDNLTVLEGAVIGGDLTYTSDHEARIDDGARIGGQIERREPAFDPRRSVIGDNPVIAYLGLLLGLLIIGWGLLLVRPRLVPATGAELRTQPLLALGLGAGAWIGQWVLVILLVVAAALIGAISGALGGGFVVAAITVVLLIVVLIFVSAVPVAMAIGTLVLPATDQSRYVVYAAGAAILALVMTIANLVGALAALAFVLVWILGLGAFILDLWRTRTQPVAPVGAPAPAAITDPGWTPPPRPQP